MITNIILGIVIALLLVYLFELIMRIITDIVEGFQTCECKRCNIVFRCNKIDIVDVAMRSLKDYDHCPSCGYMGSDTNAWYKVIKRGKH